jgi:hypothetical protein
MGSCMHEQLDAHVEISRLVENEANPDNPHAFHADITIWCRACGAKFGFRCPDVGLLPDRPAVSPDALILRAPLITPSELELLGAVAAMHATAGYAGYRVSRVRYP